jgi:hypothetical protein
MSETVVRAVRRRGSRLLLLALLCAAVLVVGGPSTSRASGCTDHLVPIAYVYYWDASHTQWAGSCQLATFSCDYYCEGSITEYVVPNQQMLNCRDCE